MRTIATVIAMASFMSAAHAGVVRFDCHVGTGKDRMPIEFVYDDVSNKAQIIGNNGINDVVVYIGDVGITFLEFLSTGAVQSTTIAQDNSVVHSRHTLMASKIIPSQMLGKCSRRDIQPQKTENFFVR